MRIGLCDDERSIRGKLKKILMEYQDEIEIYEFSSGEELINKYKKLDVLFLDIDMGEINGIEAGKVLREKDKELKIIYLTSFSDYTHLAFKVHAFAYITKPFSKEDILREIKEVVEYSKENVEEEQVVLEFMTLDGVIRLKPEEIYYFEYFNRKVNIVTQKKDYVIKDKITRIIDIMEAYNFYSPHKSFSVNLFYVKCIKGYEIFMMNEDVIPLSQKRSHKFRERLSEFISDFI